MKDAIIKIIMMRILGIDPGSRLTGYGCVEVSGKCIQMLTHGTLNLWSAKSTDDTVVESLSFRLHSLYEKLNEVIGNWKPDILAVEKVFFAKNAFSALQLGQARGAVLLTGRIHSLKTVEYSSTEVKRTIVGHGQAEKSQVAKALELRFLSEAKSLAPSLRKFKTYDASDGLALALCHAYHVIYSRNFKLNFEQTKNGDSKKKISIAEVLRLKVSL